MSAPYPARWECDVVLADGGTAHLRPTRPEDGPAIEAFHARLSDTTVLMRFFSSMRTLRPDLLQRFTHPDYERDVVLLALLGERVIALATYTAQQPDEAEVSFVVDDAHQGRGLGTLLLEHLAGIAREHGVKRFTADTLPQNRRMLQVFRDSGAPVERASRDGVVHLSFPIDSTPELEAAVERREHQGEARSVARLLAPGSVAVIGADSGPGARIVRNLVEGGFHGTVYPVQPAAAEVAGLKAYPGVRETPGPVDVAVLAVPASHALAAARECAEKHVHGLVAIAAGFAEVGAEGERVQRELVAFARAHGMRLIGPNCLGVLNTDPEVALNATLFGGAPRRGRVGLMSQSGALGMALLERAERLGLGVSSFVSAGNKADVSGNDLLQFWEEDPATDVIALYLESLGNPRKFSRIARRVSRRKPVIAVKSGRSRAGTRAAVSHTAARVHADVAVDTLFAQTGVIRVDALDELLDTARVLARQPLPGGARVAIIGNSGGAGVMAADACEQAGLEVPELSARAQARLRERLPRGAALHNPVDVPAGATSEQGAAALRVLTAVDEVDAVLAIYAPPFGAGAGAAEVARLLDDWARDAPKPVVATLLGDAPAGLGLGVPMFDSVEAAAKALARAAGYAAWRSRPPGRAPELDRIDARAAQRLVGAALEAAPGGAWLDAARAAELVETFGIPVAGAPPAGGGVATHVGVVQDAAFGPLLAFGMGGTAAELTGDRAFRILPLTDLDARELVRAPKSSPLLFGHAGAPPADVAALEDVLLRVARMAEQVPELAELKLDPVIVHESGALASDVKARVAPYAPRPELALRRLR